METNNKAVKADEIEKHKLAFEFMINKGYSEVNPINFGIVNFLIVDYAEAQTQPLLERIKELEEDNKNLEAVQTEFEDELHKCRKEIESLKEELKQVKEAATENYLTIKNEREQANKLAELLQESSHYVETPSLLADIALALEEFKEGDKG